MTEIQSKKQSKKPQYSRFSQQELPAWKPLITPTWVIGILVFVGIIFVPIGLASLNASENVVEIVERYDELCIPDYNKSLEFIQSSTTDKSCVRITNVPKKMKSPIYVYYELDNFYQSHRRYLKSRCDKQLNNKEVKNGDCKNACLPERETDDKIIVPCGLVAWSLFNDSYAFSVDNKSLDVNRKGISWSSDRNHKFGSDVYPKNFQNGGLIGGAKLDEKIPLSKQEDLIVWMRTAALPNFRKLYGKIMVDLEPNAKIDIMIKNNYNTYSFGGKKKVVLSTMSWIGGKNDFLGAAYLTIGGICLSFASIFITFYVVQSRPYGDPAYLSWNRRHGFASH